MAHSTATLNSQAHDVWGLYWLWLALATGTPTATTPGTELSGGSYARIASIPGTSSAGVNVASTATFNVPVSSPANLEGFSASSAGTYAGWSPFTAIPFGVPGTLAVTPTATQA